MIYQDARFPRSGGSVAQIFGGFNAERRRQISVIVDSRFSQGMSFEPLGSTHPSVALLPGIPVQELARAHPRQPSQSA